MADQQTIMEYSDDIASAERPKPLPPGQYKGVVRSAEFKDSKNAKKYVSVGFHITADQYPPDYQNDGNPDGTTLTWGRTSGENTPAGRYQIRKLFETLGAPLPKREVDLNQLLGLECVLVTKIDKYQGEDNAAIDKMEKA